MAVKRRHRKVLDEGPIGTHERDVRWVMSHLGASEADKPDEQKAPSDAAWKLFQMYDADSDSRMAFAERIYSKIVNKEKPKEQSGALTDDQRKFFKLFELLEIERPELLNEQFPRSSPVIKPATGRDSAEVGECESAADATVPESLVASCEQDRTEPIARRGKRRDEPEPAPGSASERLIEGIHSLITADATQGEA